MSANIRILQDSEKNSNGILTSESNEMGLSSIFSYKGFNVTFYKINNITYVNATEMARTSGKFSKDWMRLKSTSEFINTLSAVRTISPSALIQVFRGGNGIQGTFMHEDVAIEFARWLSPEFAIWCNDKVKKLLTTGVVKLNKTPKPEESVEKSLPRNYIEALEALLKSEKEKLVLAEKNKAIEEEKKIVQTELKTAISTIKEHEPVIEMFKRSIPREGVLIRESFKYFEQFGFSIAIKSAYLLLQDLNFIFKNDRGRYEAYQVARNSGYVTYGSDPGDDYWEAKAITVLITLKGFVRLEELSRKKRSLFENYGKFRDSK